MSKTKRWLVAAVATTFLAGCSDDGSILSPEQSGGELLLNCNAEISTGAISCSPLNPAVGSGTNAAILGNQGEHILLESTNVSYNGSTSVFSADVTVRNLLTQPLGSADGMGPDADGIRVFFVSSPNTTGGTGSVTVRNSDGRANFTTADQHYFEYAQVLHSGYRSFPKTWEWQVPITVTSFSFQVGISAKIPDEGTIAGGPHFRPQLIDSDSTHTCALAANGQAYCWGDGNRGRLGNGSDDDEPFPVPVEQGNLRFVSIAAALAHSCGLTDSGAAYCWGVGNLGRLGNDATPHQFTPVEVVGGHTFVQLTASRISACGLTESGHAYCWGYNNLGQLGDGTTTNQPVPALVGGGMTFRDISAGRFHTCGISTEGKSYCWGSQATGRLGNGLTASGGVSTPVEVDGGHSFARITAGHTHSCALTADGDAYCWGGSTYGRLGSGVNDEQPIPTPQKVLGGHKFVRLSIGFVHTCGVTTSGQGFCWGSQARGKLGNGETGSGSIWEPIPVADISNFVEITASQDHSCGLTTDLQAYCWGNAGTGRLGNGMGSNTGSPSLVGGGQVPH